MAVIEMKVPSPGESITEVQIARWIKKTGDYVEKDEELCEIDSDKATLTLNAEVSGTLKIIVNEGETVSVGTTVCTIDEDAKGNAPDKDAKKEKPEVQKAAAQTPAVENAKPAEKVESKTTYASGVPSVAAEKLMREGGIKTDKIKPTGKDGRITKADVLNVSTGTIDKSEKTASAKTGSGNRQERREKMSMLRKRVGERLVAVKQETAMLTTFNEVDMSAIMEIRKEHKEKFKEKFGVSLGFMSFFTKAVCGALHSWPSVNARIDGADIVFHDYCDIGIAVSAPKGLMVPVIRNAEAMSFSEIEQAVATLAGKAREGKISIDEMTGGTFTITNGGVFGSMLSTPIINPPQSAILGMHNIVERAVVVHGTIEIRPIMYVALSYDHRIIDGRESVSFLVAVKKMLEEPLGLLAEGGEPVKELLGI